MKERKDYGFYDVVVVGGGFSGVAAAIAAARNGARVALIEKYNCLGGAACFDLVFPFMYYYTKKKDENDRTVRDKILSRGIFEEIVEEMHKIGGMPESNIEVFNEEYLKLVLNRMVEKEKITVLFQTAVVDAERTGGKITGLTVSNVSGPGRINANVFVDATGDANLTDESDGLCQPMTLCFRMAGVDMEQFRKEAMTINPLYRRLRAEGKIKNPREDVLVFFPPVPGVMHFNTTRVVKLDPTDALDVTRAEFIAREQVFEMIDFLKSNFKAFADAHIISSGLQIGARESRMIDGEYVLNQDDLTAATHFDDGIAACNYDIDIHSPDGTGTSHYYFPDDLYYTIPYRCLLPKGADNLLVTGRCISVTHEAQASVRIMPTCCTLGHAAGVAAAMAATQNKRVGDVDVKALRAELRRENAVVD